MGENIAFNLIDVAHVIRRRFLTIALFVAVVGAATTVLVFLLPQFYSSTTTAVAANPMLADKARLFNPNVESLYSTFGSSDDLDRLYGIAQLDTIYATLVDQYDLASYYKAKGATPARARKSAVLQLQKDILVERNELYQLKISVLHKDATTAANIANSMMGLVESKVQAIWQAGYDKAYRQFDTAINNLQREYTTLTNPRFDATIYIDTVTNRDLFKSRQAEIPGQIQEYRKLQQEFKLARGTNAPALLVLEQAVAAVKPAKPQKLVIIGAALILSILFGVITALLYDRKLSHA